MRYSRTPLPQTPVIYILNSLKGKNYFIGSTENLQKVYSQHIDGLMTATKDMRPLVLVAYRLCDTLLEARMLETKYKKSRTLLDKAFAKSEFVSLI